MRIVYICFLLQFLFCISHGQVVTTNPAIFTSDQSITITFDATLGNAGLVGATSVHMHAGVILTGSSGTVWSNVIGQWGNPASAGQMTSIGGNKWQITIPNVRTYFGVSAGVPIYRIAMVFRESGPCGGFGGISTNCKAGRTSANGDIFVDISQGGFDIAFSAPVNFPIFKSVGETLVITGNASQSSLISIKVNGVEKAVTSNVTSINYSHVVEESGLVTVSLTANNGVETKERSFTYWVRPEVINQTRPIGSVKGINYNPSDPSKATLVLLAPQKSSVYVLGDFNNWEARPEYQMKKDGEHFWLELTGLTAGLEYAFQYLVDETIKVADPYADKILDPDDQYIPAATYPNLKAYPAKARSTQSYYNRVSVLQTNQQPYQWNVTDFEKPQKEKLVVYELLLRDFFANGERNYQNLIDTLGYFKRLGINAIQLMPIMEFNGNEGWGYNPTFMFAPDKYYGTKNKLKEFIDKCHENDIAVILDIALNHQDVPNTYATMYFDFTTFTPLPTNPWFNKTPKHPYNVFSDMNHESLYTQAYVDTINHYWLNEFKVDGFRFDLSKGFTQNTDCGGSQTNEGCFGSYDASRIAILKRMADRIWGHTPDALVILEHFAEISEEIELSNHGMMLWGNLNYAYAQNTMGDAYDSDISGISAKQRGWPNQYLVGYMESHDEERVMFKNKQSGAISGSYSAKDIPTALERMKAANAIFYLVPGPKMLWQFGELGYDYSIFEGGGRLAPKPVRWDYKDNVHRDKLFRVVADLIKLKTTYPIFSTSAITITTGTSLQKSLSLKGTPYVENPTSANEMNVHVITNFDVTKKTITTTFPHAGNWYHYFSGGDLHTLPTASTSIELQPGEFRVYTDVQLPPTEPELTNFVKPIAPALLSLKESEQGVTIEWQDKSGIETVFSIFRKENSETVFTQIGEISKNTNTFLDRAVTSRTTYQYYVAATNASGSSPSSIEDITTTDIVTSVEGSMLVYGVFPNPTTGIIHFTQPIGTFTNLQVNDMSGRSVEMEMLDANRVRLNAPRGIYVLQIKSKHDGRTERLKIVKE
jgi:1,4-alpha-glucan branching enzyme